MKLSVTFNNVEIIEIKIKRDPNTILDYLYVVFKEKNIDIDEILKKTNIIKFKFKNKHNKTIRYNELIFTTEYTFFEINNNRIELIGLLRSAKNVQSFHQYDIDIFYDWSKGLEYDLIKIDDNEFKRQYFFCCFLWNFGSYRLNCNKNLSIDCSNIKSDYDFYYLLGKTLFGDRGYLGSNLDSLEDSVIDFVIDNENLDLKSYTISFFNFGLLEDYLDINALKLILGKTKMNLIFSLNASPLSEVF
ncbi:hypothetical protein GKZ90_0013735 [Flavobacterium sp. MC2016-06]|uniref:hypothetical protein n=1 Tax=Flavobacterium sp. MC2016-06 TaxID=2676308 RepID=UPI0012BA9994|nr:hypothetical protein [Flavobacterium sp. MC2016-06]MBU3861771.1 hypothetical protein [Flavobacterium sp. MC2016-06]